MCSVLGNTADIYMAVPSERVVRLADSDDIQQALGTDSLFNERPQDAILAGHISMSNGASAIAILDRRFVLGPESAHVNISGISGLATKTSYAMFLIQSILQSGDPSKVAVILLNVKQADPAAGPPSGHSDRRTGNRGVASDVGCARPACPAVPERDVRAAARAWACWRAQ
jgi:hypothetical protein